MSPLIAPSILSANFLNLNNDLEMINNSVADYFHIDVMDGVFVPNLTYGFPIIKQIKKVTKKPLDVHLMIINPERHIEEFKNSGADLISVHIEASTHLHRTLHAIKALNMKAGVAVNPHTNINQLEDVIADTDYVCLMSVNPGYGGQKFIENTYSKIEALKNLIIKKNSKAMIEVDGGVDYSNAKKLVECGADILVAGYFIFSAKEPTDIISNLKNLNY